MAINSTKGARIEAMVIKAEAKMKGQAARTAALTDVSKMLDHLLEVQRVLVRRKDQKCLALLYPLNDALQDEYLEHLEAVVRAR